ncbi:MAG: hypothetical protein HYZ28_25865 [Myxococcales bacterium]|nr:hypothetical protein [Myxococcales bacterium]
MSWTAAERRWRDALLRAVLPPDPERHPGLGEVDLEPFFADFLAAAPPLLRAAFRATVWVLTWLPAFTFKRPLHRLPEGDRDGFLRRAGGSRSYLLRQMVSVAKAVACFAFFRQPELRGRVARRAS